jgi:hypothetical protein
MARAKMNFPLILRERIAMSQIERWLVLLPKIIKFQDLFIFAELLAFSSDYLQKVINLLKYSKIKTISD